MADAMPVKFDPASLSDRLRERIRSSLADLIPPEQWDAMMKAEIDRFFNARLVGATYDKQLVSSDFEAIVLDAVRADARERVKQYLTTDPGWQSRWDSKDNVGLLPEKLEALLRDNAHTILRECAVEFFTYFGRDVAGRAVHAIGQQIQNRGY